MGFDTPVFLKNENSAFPLFEVCFSLAVTAYINPNLFQPYRCF